jgi:hypothetical protein
MRCSLEKFPLLQKPSKGGEILKWQENARDRK